MKNRNTKDPSENHIFPFILSNLFLFIGIFFSLQSAASVAILFYSMVLNLFVHWLRFYLIIRKKIKHYTVYFNNLTIRIFCLSSVIPAFLMLLPLVFELNVGSGFLLLSGFVLSIICKYALNKYYSWEAHTEKLMSRYRLSVGQQRDENFDFVKEYVKLNPAKFSAYIEKSQLFDDKVEKLLETLKPNNKH